MAIHRFHNPKTMHATRGYSHVVETTSPSRTIYLAGQLGRTADGKFAGAPGDFRAQAVQAFDNIKTVLAAAGAKFEHMVKVTATSSTSHTCRSTWRCATNTSTPQRHRPRRPFKSQSWRTKAGLFEIEAIAVVPSVNSLRRHNACGKLPKLGRLRWPQSTGETGGTMSFIETETYRAGHCRRPAHFFCCRRWAARRRRTRPTR